MKTQSGRLATDGKPVRFRVLPDGTPPDDGHGVDAAADGMGTVTEQRLSLPKTYGPPRRQAVSAIWSWPVCINVSGLWG